jgi:hypothetical protein
VTAEVRTALISFGGVALGVVLGSMLNLMVELQRDRRADRARRRELGEDAAAALRDLCYEAADVARELQGDGDTSVSTRLYTVTRQILSRQHDIPDKRVRDALRDVVTCLRYASDAFNATDVSPREVIFTAEQTGVELLGAYRRGQQLPDFTRLARLAGWLEDWQRELFEQMTAETQRERKPPDRPSEQSK